MTQHLGPPSELAIYSQTFQPLPEPQGERIFILYKLPSLWHLIIAAENGPRQHIAEATSSTLIMLNPDKPAPEEISWQVPSSDTGNLQAQGEATGVHLVGSNTVQVSKNVLLCNSWIICCNIRICSHLELGRMSYCQLKSV